MPERRAKIERLDIAPGRRILVVSDIHGNVPYFEGVLRLAGFSGRDELIVDGDFLEKGAESLRTLRILMALSKRGNTHVVLGNCDDWHTIYLPDWPEEADENVLRYMLRRKSGLLWDMCNDAGLDPFELESLTEAKAALKTRYAAEWAFLASLPYAIETERFVFAHAGMRPDKPLAEHRPEELDHCDAFLRQGWRFDKWVIVGHWPVMLYGEARVCANPIVDRGRKIVCIDGGCVLKDDGQLNCLVIPDRDSEDFGFVAFDPFPVRTALDDQEGSERSYYIRWGDSRVEVLRRGEEFSRCRHVRTGYEMDILTKYLFTADRFTDCNDCTDYRLEVHAGDRLRIVEETSRGVLAKLNGVSGWYGGGLK